MIHFNFLINNSQNILVHLYMQNLNKIRELPDEYDKMVEENHFYMENHVESKIF